MKPTTLSMAAMAAALFFTPFVQAASPAAAQETAGNVSYISGGVGEDEAAAMKSAAAGYPLELQFVQKATPRDEFLADVKVRITDRARASSCGLRRMRRASRWPTRHLRTPR